MYIDVLLALVVLVMLIGSGYAGRIQGMCMDNPYLPRVGGIGWTVGNLVTLTLVGMYVAWRGVDVLLAFWFSVCVCVCNSQW